MATLLIVLGAFAALSGLAWLAYVSSVMKGSKGNALVGGVSATVIGGALIVLGATVSDEPEQVQQFIDSRPVVAGPTATPEAAAVPTVVPDPDEVYRDAADDVASRAGVDLARVLQLLALPDSGNPIWVNDVRQLSSQFRRYSVTAEEFAVPSDRAEVHEKLTGVLTDLATAGRLVNESLDAIQRQNVNVAQNALTEAIGIMTTASNRLGEVIDQVAP